MFARLLSKNLHTWIGSYVADAVGRALEPRMEGQRHLIFAVCDHFEPMVGGAGSSRGRERVLTWSERYAPALGGFRDADGRPPRHSWFFPGEQYAPGLVEPLAALVGAGMGEVEVHLHHDGDTAATLRQSLDRALAALMGHGLISRDAAGRPRWAFIHGNWSLANSRRDGRWCGVDEELTVLFEAGCYADFTFPSAPDESQPGIVNRIYWPTGELARRRAHHQGTRARVGQVFDDRLLMVEGPLALARRPGSLELRIESSALQAGDPPTPARLDTWVKQDVHVQGRPEWVFVKVHAHGALERNATSLLGPEGRAFHADLAARYNDGQRWALHYVTARELFNIAMAAMQGAAGDPAAYRDHLIAPPPVAAR